MTTDIIGENFQARIWSKSKCGVPLPGLKHFGQNRSRKVKALEKEQMLDKNLNSGSVHIWCMEKLCSFDASL